MLGQSLMVKGVTVIVLHAKISPFYNVLYEVISYFLNIMPTHLKNSILTFTLSVNSVLLQNGSYGQHICVPKIIW